MWAYLQFYSLHSFEMLSWLLIGGGLMSMLEEITNREAKLEDTRTGFVAWEDRKGFS